MSNFFNGTGAAHTSSRQDYETPQRIFDELNQAYGFTIDAAASPENAKLERYWTVEDDALSKSWAGERVFVNPPYDRTSKLWIKKIGEEAAGGGGHSCPVGRQDRRGGISCAFVQEAEHTHRVYSRQAPLRTGRRAATGGAVPLDAGVLQLLVI